MQPDARPTPHVLRARRTAALARAAVGVLGIAVTLLHPPAAPPAGLAVAGFALILLTAVLQLVMPASWLKAEEALALPALFIVGFSHERITVLTLLWLVAVASGVLARGGRVHWVGSLLLLSSLLLPVALEQRLTLGYLAFSVAVLGLLLTCGRVTQELRSLLSQARFDADHDSLTGALSRAAFRARLDAAAGHANALLLIDLDGFGAVNKMNGHAAGDALLQRVASFLEESLPRGAFLGRLGGDEFALAASHEDPEGLAHQLAADLAAIADPTTASVGIAVAPLHGLTADALLRAADVALRVSKRGGRGHVSLYTGGSLSDEGPEGARAVLDRLISGEGIAIFVQPIIDIATGHPHAFEALARFDTGGPSSPLQWFTLAEEFGRRPDLELACLKAALDLLDEVPGEARLSVNLSGPMLLDARTLAALLDGRDLSRLVVELTENTLVENTDEVQRALGALRAEGADLAVDDMGAGYSGLRQITTVDARYLKLDRSLITDIQESRGRQALVAALVGYARQVGGKLVAEGVETEEELEALRGLGVQLVQGYLLSRPAPPWPLMDAAGRVSAARDRARAHP